MAYAGGVYVMQLLEEDLLQFLCRILEFEESKVRDFHLKINDILNSFKIPNYCSPSYLAEMKEEFRLLAPTIVGVDLIDESALFDKVLLNDRNILKRVPHMMYQLDDIQSSLKDFSFMDHQISSAVIDHSSAILPQQSWDFANDLLSLNKEYQEVITLLLDVAEEAIYLHDRLGSFLRKIKHPNDHQVLNWIKTVTELAGDHIENFLAGNPFSLEKIDVVALMQVKSTFDYLRDITPAFHNLRDLTPAFETSWGFKPQPRRPQGWRHKWQHFFCIHREYEQDDTYLRDSQSCSTSKTKSLQTQGPQVQEDPMELSAMHSQSISQTEGSRESLLEREQIAIGLDDDINKIIDELTGPQSRLSILKITGMGGIGKTTLAKQVFHHPTIVHHFHFLAWVNGVTSTEQVLSHLLHSITTRNEINGQSSEQDSRFLADEIQRKGNEIHGHTSEVDKGEMLWKSLRKRKYLIVVDDLWKYDAWIDLERYFPDDQVGSRILITSRHDLTFPTVIPHMPPHSMRLLNENESWEMLEQLVFGEKSCPSELVALGKLIATECRGLRLAIVVIAGTLLSIPRSYSSWSSVMNGVNSALGQFSPTFQDQILKCLDILALSYKYLPHHLKACFLFMGSFPENCEIDAQKLINLWIAAGFLDFKSTNHSQKVAEDYLENLIGRCLVLIGQRTFDGKIKTCSIHELLRHFCLREASRENFMQILSKDAKDQGLERKRHLIFNSTIDEISSLPSLRHLQSFIMNTPDFDVSPEELVSQLSFFKWLRVLDMYFLPLDTFPREILDLVNLRYLALNITYVLDASISQLWKLQTLVIYGPWIPRVGQQSKYLPTLYFDFWKMPWLRNVSVRVPCCFRYCSLPQRLRDGYPVQSNLQTLSTITFSSCRDEVFFLMPKIKNLGVFETKEDYENGEYRRCFENLPFLTELEVLKCSFYYGNGEARILDLNVLPVNLKKLTLSGSRLPWDKMELLALLPKLETLKLKNYAFQGSEWVLDEEVFRCLKHLLIDNTDLLFWEAGNADHFPYLKHLELRSCKSLKYIPCEEFAALEQINLHKCSESAERSAREFNERFGWPKVMVTGKKRVVEKGGQSFEYEY